MSESHRAAAAGWRAELTTWLADLDGRARRRTLVEVERHGRFIRRARGDHALINLSSNDYLAFADHPKLRAAAEDAARRYGVGTGAGRLVSGDLTIVRELERRFAAFKHADAALLLPTGYMANLAVVTALAGPGDVVLLDKLNHASLIDAARLSGATMRVYPHRNLDRLRRLLERYAEARRRVIVTDAVFSMDGDAADLPALCELRDRFNAILIVDEAHATGLTGPTGAGLAEQQGVAGAIDATVSTASKALGSLGGLITADQLVIDTVVNAARSFIFTTGAMPIQAAAIGAALDVIRDEPQRRRRLADLSVRLRGLLRQRGWDAADTDSPIIPLIIGDDAAALTMAGRLERAGYFVPAIRPPTVPPGSARLRVSLRCDLTDDDLTGFADALGPR